MGRGERGEEERGGERGEYRGRERGVERERGGREERRAREEAGIRCCLGTGSPTRLQLSVATDVFSH